VELSRGLVVMRELEQQEKPVLELLCMVQLSRLVQLRRLVVQQLLKVMQL